MSGRRGIVVVGLLVCACGPGDSPGGEQEGATPEGGAAVTAGGPGRAMIDTVDVALLEYVIGMQSTLAAGPVALRISNQGFEIHNLRFFSAEEEAPRWTTETDLTPGETRVVDLDLEPGSYTVLCDVAGHDTRGMRIAIEVETPAGS